MVFGVPECDFIPSLRMFRVRKAIGKAFTSGGFGMTLVVVNDDCTTNTDESLQKKISTTTKEHLFVEEALFLFERGVLDVYDEHSLKMEARGIYRMLTTAKIPISVYLTYAHLRAQDYRVLRHVSNTNHGDGDAAATIKEARQHLVLQTLQENPTAIAFDVYKPNTQFRKTSPEIPEMVVAVTNFQQPSLRFEEMQALLAAQCSNEDGVSLKLATVSDSGVVIMFGITGDGVPDILLQQRNDDDDVTA